MWYTFPISHSLILLHSTHHSPFPYSHSLFLSYFCLCYYLSSSPYSLQTPMYSLPVFTILPLFTSLLFCLFHHFPHLHQFPLPSPPVQSTPPLRASHLPRMGGELRGIGSAEVVRTGGGPGGEVEVRESRCEGRLVVV